MILLLPKIKGWGQLKGQDDVCVHLIANSCILILNGIIQNRLPCMLLPFCLLTLVEHPLGLRFELPFLHQLWSAVHADGWNSSRNKFVYHEKVWVTHWLFHVGSRLSVKEGKTFLDESVCTSGPLVLSVPQQECEKDKCPSTTLTATQPLTSASWCWNLVCRHFSFECSKCFSWMLLLT